VSANFTISAIIKAVDKITAPVAAINSRVNALTAPVRRVNAAVAALGNELGVTRLTRSFCRLFDSAKNAGSAIGGVLAPLTAIAATAAGFGLYQITQGFVDAGDEADATAQKLRITTQELQRMRFAADKLDVSQETLDGGLKRLSRSITMASKGAKDQVQALRLLGYTDRQIRSGKISVADATVRLAKRMEDEKKAKSNAIIANSLYGRSYLELMPMLKAGGEGIAEQIRLAEELGVVMSDKAVASAAAFDDASKNLRYSLIGVRNAIGEQLIPILTPLVEQLTSYIAANRELIATNVTQFITEFSARMKEIDWGAVAKGAATIATGLLFLVQHVDKLAAAWVAFKAIGVATALVQLAVSLGITGAAMLAFGANTAFALGIATKGLLAFMAPLLANPITLALAAIGAAAALIIANWDVVGPYFKALWDGLKEGVAAVGDFITDIFDRVLGKILEVIDKIKDGIATIRSLATDNALTRGFNNLFGTSPAAPAPTPAPNGGLNVTGIQPNAAQPVARDAQANVVVDFKNVPKGTRVNSDVQGKGMNLGVDVGYQTGGSF
jgi:hypothetical protein